MVTAGTADSHSVHHSQRMPIQIECEQCETILLSSAVGNPKPIGRTDCPLCGETTFAFVDQ